MELSASPQDNGELGGLPLSALGYWVLYREPGVTPTLTAPTVTAIKPPGPAEAKLDRILMAIADTKQDLGGRVDMAVVELSLLHDDQRKLSEKITQTEIALQTLQLAATYFEGRVKELPPEFAGWRTEQKRLKAGPAITAFATSASRREQKGWTLLRSLSLVIPPS
ncbi:hypothetical protein NDU88_009012 [Pleurodeles waltl]|uniref:Uncharacterized protein n=1 Tax=Pleurodeles waltl TaxID=8319 RepID=A0AAV7RZT1_PLEWA|nr:hypothetical protein NDU88_009012 [Pleurodeles waltl]